MQPRVVDDDLVRLHIEPDAGRYGPQPFNFVHREYLVALGVAREVEAAGGRLVFGVHAGGTRWELEAETVAEDTERETPFFLDERGLATYHPPAGHTDGSVLECAERPSARVTVSSTGTRIDPVAAQWLWDQRTKIESEPFKGVLTSAAWCTFCGRHFVDQRAAPGSGHRQIAKRCPGCRHTKAPQQLRKCAADDCTHYFRPATARGLFCTPRCKEAQRLRDARARKAVLHDRAWR